VVIGELCTAAVCSQRLFVYIHACRHNYVMQGCSQWARWLAHTLEHVTGVPKMSVTCDERKARKMTENSNINNDVNFHAPSILVMNIAYGCRKCLKRSIHSTGGQCNLAKAASNANDVPTLYNWHTVIFFSSPSQPPTVAEIPFTTMCRASPTISLVYNTSIHSAVFAQRSRTTASDTDRDNVTGSSVTISHIMHGVVYPMRPKTIFVSK